MIFKNLGNSDVKISPIGLGLGGNFGKGGDRESIQLVKAAVNSGINFFDTAEVYLDGHSEEILGRAIRGKRDKVIIASKFSPNHSTKRALVKALDGSLKRLKSEYIDLYQVHWPNLSVPLNETISTLEAEATKGKIRFIGVSNFSLLRIKKTLKKLKYFSLSSVQNEYNFSERSSENEILPFCRKNQITFIAYNPLGPRFPLKVKKQSKLLVKLVKKYGKTETQVVLNWLISKKNVVAIPGTTSFAHLKENVNSASFTLDKSDLDNFDKVFFQKIHLIPTDNIEVLDDKKTYLSLDEAVRNEKMFVPSPLELSKEIKAGEFLKPIKVKKNKRRKRDYQLSGGKIRYWAWVIAFGGKRPIPAVIE